MILLSEVLLLAYSMDPREFEEKLLTTKAHTIVAYVTCGVLYVCCTDDSSVKNGWQIVILMIVQVVAGTILALVARR